ncbi:protein FAR1-RELATED SEQUENCE 5-like [Papaver somniferum]|uniref:protein FAR1-RELATED SEQUENCE 5-like n=1 Tax=Papaver somniferum TaxID=3469 RepID=UPI000E70275E|nr:protein FAR1-RELATED SEQUENCE 5-like [Papaver somniferum]
MPESAKDLTEAFNRDNLRIAKVPSVFGGSTIGFDKRDCYNHLHSVRRHELENGDAQSVLDYFQRKQGEYPQFFYALQVDDDGRAVKFFWVDARSRMAYEDFGDVVTFDTTYRTNKYQMPFTPFTGVNHHYGSIQFGSAFLQDESEPTFVWLFEKWIEAMGGRHPKSIITDQDGAMCLAVRKVFPNTRHRLCLWHIKKKFGEKLSHIYFSKSKFKCALKICIHWTYNIVDFEQRWTSLIKEFHLEDNDWLRTLYEIREDWIPVYHRDTFYAGMNTTSRSEGANALFNDFFSPKTNLREFVIRYDQALTKIVETEISEDYISEHKDRLINENNIILKHAATIYTRNIFDKFRAQFVDSICFRSEEIEGDGIFKMYLVRANEGPTIFTVKLKLDPLEAYCTFQYFEFMGLPCKHVLRVFNRLEIDEISSHFILKRWLKGENLFRVMDETTTWDKYGCAEALRLTHLCRLSTKVWSDASKCDDLYKMELEGIEVIATQLAQELRKREQNIVDVVDQDETSNIQEQSDKVQVQDPHISKTKGRPPKKKVMSVTLVE